MKFKIGDRVITDNIPTRIEDERQIRDKRYFKGTVIEVSPGDPVNYLLQNPLWRGFGHHVGDDCWWVMERHLKPGRAKKLPKMGLGKTNRLGDFPRKEAR